MINLPKVHFFFAGLIPESSSGQAMQTFCSINIQLQSSTPQFQQRKNA